MYDTTASDESAPARLVAGALVDILERDQGVDARRLMVTAEKPADRMAH